MLWQLGNVLLSFSTEAGLKYFLLGAFSSGILLFGCSLIYGFTGITNFSDLAKLFTCGNEEIIASIPFYEKQGQTSALKAYEVRL